MTSVIETLTISIPCDRVEKFVWADNETWTRVLQTLPGFVQKTVTIDPSTANASECVLWNFILWESYELKSVPASVLKDTNDAMAEMYGGDVPVTPFPSGQSDGLKVLYDDATDRGCETYCIKKGSHRVESLDDRLAYSF